MKLEIYLSDGTIKNVLIPEFENFDQHSDHVLSILMSKHKINPHDIMAIIEKTENSIMK